MLHGVLLDKYGEFFIQKAPVAALTDGDVGDDAPDDDQDLGLLGGVTTKQLNNVLVWTLSPIVRVAMPSCNGAL